MSIVTSTPVIPRIAHAWQPKPFPVTVLRFVEACNKDGFTAKELGQIVTADPSLAASILKMANSSAMGCGQKIKSIDHAIVLIGMKGLKQLALVHGSTKLFQEGSPQVKQARLQVYNHTLQVACWLRNLAKLVPKHNAEEMFLIGMLHDIGKLMYLDHVPAHYAKVLEAQLENKLPTLERHLFGLDHAELGARCLLDWKLPEVWCEVVRLHHEPANNQIEQLLRTKVQLVACANYITWYQGKVDLTSADFKEYLQQEFSEMQALTDLADFAELEQKVNKEIAELQSISS